MNRAKKLIKEYPDLFPSPFGIECGDGWLELIRFVCKALQYKVNNRDVVFIHFSQIKEKFGFLRIYFNFEVAINTIHGNTKQAEAMSEELRNLISTVEELSGIVCEDCGRMKNDKFNVQTRTPRGMWKRTVCDECYKIEKNRTTWKS